MPMYFNDPTIDRKEFVKDQEGRYLEASDGFTFAKRARSICIEAAKKIGWLPSGVVVINRAPRKTLEGNLVHDVRIWDLERFPSQSEVLVGSVGNNPSCDWRIATKEEWAEEQKRREVEIKKATERQAVDAAKSMLAAQRGFKLLQNVTTLAAGQANDNLINPVGQMTAEQIAEAEAALATLKAKSQERAEKTKKEK